MQQKCISLLLALAGLSSTPAVSFCLPQHFFSVLISSPHGWVALGFIRVCAYVCGCVFKWVASMREDACVSVGGCGV